MPASQVADGLPERAHAAGIRAAFAAGDEVYGGRELRRSIRRRGMGYVMAVRAGHHLATRPCLAPDAHRVKGPRASAMTTGRSWR
jgi:hypothetical protein